MSGQPEGASPGVPQEHCNNVCAVIVAYFPDLMLLQELLDSIVLQVDATVIVDNTARHHATDLSALLVKSRQHMYQTIPFGENRGIAAAQNAGIAWAQLHGFKYALLLDQDSIPQASMVSQLVSTSDDLIAQGIPLAAVGPRYVDPRSGRSSKALQVGPITTRQVPCADQLPTQIIHCDILISSGSLLYLESLEAIGTLDESLFIDHVDHEWCLRARHKGYSFYVVCGAVLTHCLGSDTVRYWLGRWRTFPAHSTTRHYYMLRNALLLAHRPHIPRAWLLGEFSALLPNLVAAFIFLPERGRRLVRVLHAFYDGLRNRCGPLDAS